MNRLPDFDQLAKKESFDPKVLISDNEEEQKLNNFILTLALVYNDVKDVVWANENLKKADFEKNDKGGSIISEYNGQYFGFQNHITKLYYSILCELYELIINKSEIVKSAVFVNILKMISKDARTTWEELINFTIHKKEGTRKEFKEVFEKVRNCMTSHYYNCDEIGKGYKHHVEKMFPEMDAYISRSQHGIKYVRFYFADAAVSGYMHRILQDRKESLSHHEIFIEAIAESIYQIVDRYINSKTAYR